MDTGIWVNIDGYVNRIAENDVVARDTGINVASMTGGNVFVRNTVLAKHGVGCADATAPGGSGTAGTNNTWRDNTANSDSPDGICPPAP